MDGVGESIKNDIVNALTFNRNSVITSVSELWGLLPKDNKQTSMHSEEDGHRCKEMLLSDLKILCRSFGISTAHAIQVFVLR